MSAVPVVAVLAVLAAHGHPTQIIDQPCPVAPRDGCTFAGVDPWGGTDRVWATGPTRVERRHTTQHELGHRVDYALLTDADRDRWRREQGERRPWRSPPNSPHEQFAESFAYCVIGRRDRRRLEFAYDGWPPHRRLYGSGYGWEPTPARARRACRLVREVLDRP